MLSKAATLCHLQNEILSLQGFKPATATTQRDFGLGHILHSFPHQTFPFSALHEFICQSPQEVAASGAFVSGLFSSALNTGGVALWICTNHRIFPPALKAFGINPDQLIFVQLKKEKEVTWAVEEALKCTAITTVVCEIAELDFTESRRFQLAIEQSGVGCFLLRYRPRNLTTASTTRWQIKPLSSTVVDKLPGIGYPRWKVDLHKVRGGTPGTWEIEWVQGHFQNTTKLAFIPGELKRKTG